MGASVTTQPGMAWRTPAAMLAATALAGRLPLKESGATSTLNGLFVLEIDMQLSVTGASMMQDGQLE
jgi:hypothetical protein